MDIAAEKRIVLAARKVHRGEAANPRRIKNSAVQLPKGGTPMLAADAASQRLLPSGRVKARPRR